MEWRCQKAEYQDATTTALNESKPQKRKKETLGKRIKQLIKKNMDTHRGKKDADRPVQRSPPPVRHAQVQQETRLPESAQLGLNSHTIQR